MLHHDKLIQYYENRFRIQKHLKTLPCSNSLKICIFFFYLFTILKQPRRKFGKNSTTFYFHLSFSTCKTLLISKFHTFTQSFFLLHE